MASRSWIITCALFPVYFAIGYISGKVLGMHWYTFAVAFALSLALWGTSMAVAWWIDDQWNE